MRKHRKPPNWRRLKKEAEAGAIDLFHLDESGFAPTLPTGYTWAKTNHRPIVAHEAPQGRRVNVVGAIAPFDPDGPRLLFESRKKSDGPFDAAAYLAFVHKVAGLPDPLPDGLRRERPCIIVQDNYSVHVCTPVQKAIPGLAKAGVTLFQLPAYSPKMNRIESLWRQVKYHDMPVRSHKTDTDLQQAVNDALNRRAHMLRKRVQNLQGTA